MEITDEQFEAAYASATPAQKYLCTLAGNELLQIAEKHRLTNPDIYKMFSLIVGDVVLGFYKSSDLPAIFARELGLVSETANSVARDLLDFLAPLSDETWQPPQETTDIALEVEAMESALETLPQVRTMPQAPTGSEPVYTSTQAAILHESAQSVPAPTPSPARWETEQ